MFNALALYLDEYQGSEDLISTTSLEHLIKFNLLLSPDHLLEQYIIPNRISIYHVAQSSYIDYRKMRSEYQLLLCSFIQKCNNNILYRFLMNIFSNDYSIRIQYKLLKIYYLSRNKCFMETIDKKQSDLWKAYFELFTAQNNANSTANQEDEKHHELIKSILLQLLFEAKSKTSLLFSKDDEAKGKDTLNNTTNLITLGKNKMNMSDEASLINLSYQSSNTMGDNKSVDNSIIMLKNIVFNLPISFNLVKSIFLLNYDDWDPKAKTSFISENKTANKDNFLELYTRFNLCLNKFNRSKKNHIAYYIQLLYKLDNTESRVTLDNGILLFINYLYQIYRAHSFSQHYRQQNIECQYVHLFESKAIMCAFFAIAVDSTNGFTYAKALLKEITFNLIWTQNSFIFKYTYTSIKHNAYDMIFIMKLIVDGFNTNINLLSKNEKIPEEKSMNIINFIIVVYKLFYFNKIPKDLFQSDTISSSLFTLIKSFKERTVFLYSNLLFQVSKKHKMNQTLFQIVIELLFKLSELTEKQCEIEPISKILSLNKNSICFHSDLRKRKKEKKDQFKYKEIIKESDIQICDNKIKSKYGIKDSEEKLGVVILYMHTVKYIQTTKEKGLSVDLEAFVSIIQSEIIEIYSLLGTSYYDKNSDSLYNKIIKQIMLSLGTNYSKGEGTKPSYNIFTSIDHVITNEEEEMIEINDKVSYTTEHKPRKDSFSVCNSKCREIIHSKYEITQMTKPITREQRISSVFQIEAESILCIKRDLLLKHFGIYFKDIYFNNTNFNKVKRAFKTKYPPSDQNNSYYNQDKKQELNYPSKIKNYSNAKSNYPKILLKQDLEFFSSSNQYFHITCSYIDRSVLDNKQIKLHHGLLNRPDMRLFSNKTNNCIPSLSKYICERISVDNICFGYLFVYTNFLIYQSDTNFDSNQEYKTNPLYTYSSIRYDVFQKQKQIVIPISLIQEVISRRYIFRNQAIELFLLNGKSYYFNLFTIKNQSDLITQLSNLNHGIYVILNYKKEFFEINEYHIKWKNDKMSTFDYLLQVNKYGGRSFNDLNQYPIMPWFFTQLKPQLIRRNFQFPMSAQNEKMKGKALKNYSPTDNELCHYHVHYSNVAFVNTYLVKMIPFTYNQIRFQSNKFDIPDRQFHSFDSILSKISGQNVDNRELIPEVLSMSEYALNLNYCEFGRKTCKQLINNLELPDVFSSPVSLMIFFKNSFNANPVKEKIHLWIDYTFGINQEDKRKESLTLYPRYTYENHVLQKFDSIQKQYENNVKKMMDNIIAIKENFFNIGQTPIRLFETPHPVFTINQGNYEKDFLDPVREIFYDNQLINKSLGNKRVACICKAHNSTNIFFISRKSPIKTVIITEQDLNVINKLGVDKLSYLNKTKNGYLIYHPKYLISEIGNCDLFLTCRYYNNTIKLFGISKKIKYVIMTESFVSSIKLNHQTSFFSGHQNGKLVEWNICYIESQFNSLQDVKSVRAHKGRVNAIELNRKLEIIITGGDDHIIYLRKMYDFELLNVIELKQTRIPVDIQMAPMFDLVYVKIYDSVTQMFCLVLYTLNGIRYNKMPPVQWFEYFITTQTKVLYLDNSNVLYQMSRDLKQKIKNTKLKGEVASFVFFKREKTIIYSYDNGNFEKIHFDLN